MRIKHLLVGAAEAVRVAGVVVVAAVVALAAGGCAGLERSSPAGGAGEETGVNYSHGTGPLRVGIVGMSHGHVEGLLWAASKRDDLKIVGVAEDDRALFDRLAAKYHLDPALYHKGGPEGVAEMVAAGNPEAVSVMSPIGGPRGHVMAVEACAPRGVHLLLEKPLAYSRSDAARISELAAEHHVLVLTNFETSWYASLREARRMVESGERAPLTKMVFRHGHKGPREIGCSAEFLAWLTDPRQNGGGAITDFGCYGAVLSTWMMHGQHPSSVVAATNHLKPAVYPRVDDDATIILTYPTATAVLEASWAWTHDSKEMDLYTNKGSVHCGKWDDMSIREPNAAAIPVKPPAKPEMLENEWTYLRHAVRGECPVDPLSSLEYNVIVAEILEDARRCAERAAAHAPSEHAGPPTPRS